MFRLLHRESGSVFLNSSQLRPTQHTTPCHLSIPNSPNPSRRRRREAKSKMIYRNWSLLSSTVIIWGGVASVGLAGIFVTGAKDKFMDYLKHEGARLRQEDRAMIAQAKST